MLFQCWVSVVDGGPTLKQHWINVFDGLAFIAHFVLAKSKGSSCLLKKSVVTVGCVAVKPKHRNVFKSQQVLPFKLYF